MAHHSSAKRHAASPRCPAELDPRKPPPELILDPRRTTRPPPKERKFDDHDPWEEGGCGTHTGFKPDPSRRLHFDIKWRARTVRISPDHASASIRHEQFGGFLLSKQPLKRMHLGRYFEVRIDEIDTQRWSDGLGIGLASKPRPYDRSVPSDVLGTYEGYACEVFSESWLLGYDGRGKFCGISRYLHGKELPMGMWRPNELMAGDILGILNTPEGYLLLFVNDELRNIAFNANIPWNTELYAALDMDGCTQSVFIMDNNGHPSETVQQIMLAIREEEIAQDRRGLDAIQPDKPQLAIGNCVIVRGVDRVAIG